VLALIACMQGRRDDARRALDEIALGGLASLERDEHFLLTTAVLSDVITELGDRARAAELYALLLPYAHLLSLHDLLRTFAGSVSGELGELALALGRCDEAVAHYEEALRRESAAGARAAVVSSRVGLARALNRRGAMGDGRRADALLREAAREAEALGIDWAARFDLERETFRDLKA
jgi:tetratricopeptide (TPR) repeat protein